MVQFIFFSDIQTKDGRKNSLAFLSILIMIIEYRESVKDTCNRSIIKGIIDHVSSPPPAPAELLALENNLNVRNPCNNKI